MSLSAPPSGMYRAIEEQCAECGAPVSGVDPETGLTPAEQEISDALAVVYRGFSALPKQHPDEMGDVVDAIHIIQGILTTRIARRHYPKGWPVKA